MSRFYAVVLRILYYINNKYVYRILRLVFAKRLSNVLVHITNKCNYNCRYCYVNKSQSALEREKWMSILEEIKRLRIGKIGILGGEPFCEMDLLESVLKRAKQLGLKAYIYTNGSLITQDLLSKLVEYNPVLIYKYDFDYDTYQYNTQQDEYSLEDIEDKIRISRRYGLRVITFTVLMKQNIDRIEDIFKRSLELGALPAFERYLPVKEARINDLFEVSDEDYSKAMVKLFSCMKGFKRECLAAIRILGRSCGCYGNVLSIYPSGEVLPCPYLPERASLGNVKEKSLKELYAIMRDKIRSEYKITDACRDCGYLNECSGGCFTYSFLKTGKYLPHCNISAGFCAYFLVDIYNNLHFLNK